MCRRLCIRKVQEKDIERGHCLCVCVLSQVRLDPTGSKKKWDLDYIDLNIWSTNFSATFECKEALRPPNVTKLTRYVIAVQFCVGIVLRPLTATLTDVV